MSYIGATPTIGGYHKLDSITTDGSASYTMQLDSANFVPESVNHLIVSVNGVIQAPVDSFTVSSSTITFASSLSVSDTIDFIMALGNVLDIGVPSDGTVSLSKLTATGTKDATTFLRGDNTFAVPAGGENTPAFLAVRSSGNVTPSANTWTNYTFDTAHINLGSGFSTSDGYFTVPSGGAGYYYFTSQFFAAEIDDEQIAQIRHGFDIGGAGSFSSNTERTRSSSSRGVGTNKIGAMPQVQTLAQLSVGDKVNTQVYVESGGIFANAQINYFIGYKLIG